MSKLLETLKNNSQEIINTKKDLLLLVRILRGESRTVEGHTDPNAYYECWAELEEKAEQLSKGIDELNKTIKILSVFPDLIKTDWKK